MTNEMIEKLTGKDCWIFCFESNANVQGKITNIKDNWIEVETKKGIELVNAEFVAKFKIL